jgi:hypothetical protein
MILVTDPNGVMCSSCYRTVSQGGAMLEGTGGSLYCSPDCFARGEEDEEFDDEGISDEDYNELTGEPD